MKKYIFAFAFLILAIGASAQSHEKGQLTFDLSFAPLIGADESIFINGDELELVDKDVQANGIRLDAGYGLGENISLGLIVRNNIIKVAPSEEPTSKSYHWGFGLECRYHVLVKDNYNVYGGLAGGYNLMNFENEEEDGEGQSGFFGSIGVGGHYYFTDKFGLSVRLGIGQRNFQDGHTIQGVTTDLETKISGVETAIGISIKL